MRSEDGGSFGTLVATFNSNTCSINIPKDDNGDYIGDSWEPSAWKDGRDTPHADEETGPNAGTGVEANTQVGDCLVIFEEYRGFEIAGSHTRLSPTQKDVFVVIVPASNGNVRFANAGIGYATNLPSVFSLHVIEEDETEGRKKDNVVIHNALDTPTV